MDLIERYGFKSKDAAEALGLTQAAVSQYLSSKRGQRGVKLLEKSRKAEDVINNMLERIVAGNFSFEEEIDYICKLCETLREELIDFEEIEAKKL